MTHVLPTPFHLGLVAAELAGCILWADFLSGFYHWLEDAYGEVHWPLVGKHVIEPNLLHHEQPRAMTKNSWWSSANVPILLGLGYLAVRAALHLLTWRVCVVMALLVNANEVHKWAHRSPTENGRLIAWLQRQGWVQSPKQHAEHHRGLKNQRYCTLTDHVNPFLDRVRFWERIEVGLYRAFGWRRRLDRAWLGRLEQKAA